MIKIDEIEKIMEVVNKFDVSHFEFHQGESKVIIDKNPTEIIEANKECKEIIKSKLQTASEKIDECSKEEEEEGAEEKEYIKAAFPGTFYSVKEQGGPAFVNLNDQVEPDTIVCLVEVMKLFNEVQAGIKGTIVDILVKDGDFVEYGEPLFEIKRR